MLLMTETHSELLQRVSVGSNEPMNTDVTAHPSSAVLGNYRYGSSIISRPGSSPLQSFSLSPAVRFERDPSQCSLSFLYRHCHCHYHCHYCLSYHGLDLQA